VGPLRYRLVARDDWGEAAIADLRAHVQAEAFEGPAHRELIYGDLGNGLVTAAPPDAWTAHDMDTGCVVWLAEQAGTAFVTPSPDEPRWTSRYHFPWHAVVQDAAARGGVIVHAALVACGARAWLITAPPGGGKTTTVSRLPQGWRLMGDDACLLWPEGGGFVASPLPTWSHMLGVNDMPPGLDTWRVAETLPVAGAVVLHKGDEDGLTPLAPMQAVTALYRAFSEHPVVLDTRTTMRELILDTVVSLSEAVPCLQLELTLERTDLGALFAAVADA
jgi:SynChlorMet cassette protein ScmC